MSQHTARIKWQRNIDEIFSDNQYSRAIYGSLMEDYKYPRLPLLMLSLYRFR